MGSSTNELQVSEFRDSSKLAFLLQVGGLECQGGLVEQEGVMVWTVGDRLAICLCKDNVLRRDKKSPIKSAFGLGFGVEGMVEKVYLGDTSSTLVVLL